MHILRVMKSGFIEAKPSINIKNCINNGSIDFSERGI